MKNLSGGIVLSTRSGSSLIGQALEERAKRWRKELKESVGSGRMILIRGERKADLLLWLCNIQKKTKKTKKTNNIRQRIQRRQREKDKQDNME
jgi:hypothetical protein